MVTLRQSIVILFLLLSLPGLGAALPADGGGGSTTQNRSGSGTGNQSSLAITDPHLVFDESMGGPLDAGWNDVLALDDGGYLLVGYRETSGNNYDGWVMKKDSNRSKQWSDTFGGARNDTLQAAVQTDDGSYILVGWSRRNRPNRTGWLLKLDSNGDRQWGRSFERTTGEFESILAVDDGDYVAVGHRESAGDRDMWAVKISNTGTIRWTNTYGGNGTEIGRDVARTNRSPQDHYVLVGHTSSYSTGPWDSSVGSRRWNGYAVKIAENGTQIANETYGREDGDFLRGIVKSTKNRFVVIGSYGSEWTGSQWDHHNWWMFRIGYDLQRGLALTSFGKATNNLQDIVRTDDNRYVVGGYTGSEGSGPRSGWMFQTDVNFLQEWSETFGGNGTDAIYAVSNDANGPIVVAGSTNSDGRDTQAWFGGVADIATVIAGDDRRIDTAEILHAIDYWSSGTAVPNTGGKTIGIAKLLQLIDYWSSGARV